jgi:hypothetical protein
VWEGEGEDICWGEEPHTETIAEDDDLCHKDVEEKSSCRGPGQPEFFEVTFKQVMTAPDTKTLLDGVVVYEYTQDRGLYVVKSGEMNVNMTMDCGLLEGV